MLRISKNSNAPVLGGDIIFYICIRAKLITARPNAVPLPHHVG